MLLVYPHPQPLSQHQERGAWVFIVWLEGFSFSCWRPSPSAIPPAATMPAATQPVRCIFRVKTGAFYGQEGAFWDQDRCCFKGKTGAFWEQEGSTSTSFQCKTTPWLERVPSLKPIPLAAAGLFIRHYFSR